MTFLYRFKSESLFFLFRGCSGHHQELYVALLGPCGLSQVRWGGCQQMGCTWSSAFAARAVGSRGQGMGAVSQLIPRQRSFLVAGHVVEACACWATLPGPVGDTEQQRPVLGWAPSGASKSWFYIRQVAPVHLPFDLR